MAIKQKKITIFIFLFIIGGSCFFGLSWYENILSYTLCPFLIIEKKIIVPIKRYMFWRRGMADLQDVARRLYQERNNAVRDSIALYAELNYMCDSRECREFKKRYDLDKAFTAQVILKHFSSQGQFFLVDKGYHHGIEEDMVAVYNNVLVGRVNEVYPFYSKLILVTDENCHVAAVCSLTGAQGIHKGTNSSLTELAFVSHLDDVSEGDIVVSHGKGLIFPRGFGLGRIRSVEQRIVDYVITVEPLIDLHQLEFCLLLQKGDY